MGIGTHLRERQITPFRLGDRIYALGSRESGSAANVLSRRPLGDVGGEPVVVSSLYKQRICLRNGWSYDSNEQMVRT